MPEARGWARSTVGSTIRETYEALLPRLMGTRTVTREGVFARFEALLQVLEADDNPVARAFLKSCIGDLKRLWT